MTRTVDICVCTFRRPSLADTLRSLAALDWPPKTTGRVVVIDNDAVPSAKAVVAEFACTSAMTVQYLHRSGGNISLARNAALDAAEADFLAFLDDDEIASRGWIAALLSRQAATSADAVLGPVRPVYGPGAPRWMVRAEPHATRPVWKGGAIRTGYTCNVLIDRRSPRLAGLRFDAALGRSGGEDSSFFTALHRRGGQIAYAPEAWVSEAVPPDRARLDWLVRRRWRMGVTHLAGRLEGAPAPTRAAAACIAAAKAAACAAGMVATAPAAHLRNRWLVRGALHCGAVWGALGGRPPVLYGAPRGEARGDA